MVARYVKLSTALSASLKEVSTLPSDRAAIALARLLCQQIDDEPGLLPKLSKDLLSVLIQLGMTPAARNAVVKSGGTASGGSTALDQLRARRNARVNPAKAVDSPAS